MIYNNSFVRQGLSTFLFWKSKNIFNLVNEEFHIDIL